MIAVLALLGVGELSAARFFPLVPGNHWVYTDSESGATIEKTVKPLVIQTTDEDAKDSEIEHLPNYYPVEEKDDGEVASTMPCYVDKGNRVYLVGTGINHPVSERVVVVVTKEAYQWRFYGTAISPIQTDAVKYDCTSVVGPDETVLGAKHETVVVKIHATVGDKKNGIDLNQTWKYAADIGLYELDEQGRVGSRKVNHTEKLVKFDPGVTVAVPGSKV